MNHHIAKPVFASGLGLGVAAIVLAVWSDSRVGARLLPHGYCFTWDPTLLGMHIVGDSLIGLAYLSIPLSLIYFVRGRRDLPFNWIFVLFATFILSCGTTHWVDVWTIWRPNYWLAGSVKLLTAFVSVLTAVALFRLIPVALALPTVEELRRAKEALEVEVSNSHRLLHEAQALREEAERANRVKTAFLATVSHEIRTPMNGILGTADLLARSALPQAQKGLAATLVRSGRSLMAIIDDILDITKIEADELKVVSAPFSPLQAATEVYELFGSYAAGKGLKFELEVADGVPAAVLGDRQRVQQILGNLTSNALKFTSTGGVRLLLGAKPANAGSVLLRFEVEDTGIGIDQAARDRIFEPFAQADSTVGRRFGGTGLGLAISRKLARLMGGDVDFASAPAGTRFWFEVVLPAADGAPVHDERAGPAFHFVHSGATPLDGATTGQGQDQDQDQDQEDADALSNLHVLVVEDNSVNAIVIEAQLAKLGCTCDIATTGETALQALQHHTYDCVLMDWMLPDITGGEVARRWREMEDRQGRPRVPIIAVTANAFASNLAAALGAGMDDYLTKPCTTEQLGAVLRKWIRAE